MPAALILSSNGVLNVARIIQPKKITEKVPFMAEPLKAIAVRCSPSACLTY